MELGNESLVDERRPALPGIEHIRHVVPRPRHAEEGHSFDGAHSEGERRGDAEVAAATTAQGPEEIRVLFRAGAQRRAIRIDQVNGEEVVAGETVLAGQEPEPATERQPRDPDALAGPGGQREAVLPETTVEIAQADPGTDAHFTASRVDTDLAQAAKVDDQPGIDG